MTKTTPPPEPPPPTHGGSYIWDEATGERRRVVPTPAPTPAPDTQAPPPDAGAADGVPAEPAAKGARK